MRCLHSYGQLYQSQIAHAQSRLAVPVDGDVVMTTRTLPHAGAEEEVGGVELAAEGAVGAQAAGIVQSQEMPPSPWKTPSLQRTMELMTIT